MRNNFVLEYGHAPGDYNWRTNRQTLIRYWGDRIKESKNNPAVYGIGMRGIHDSGMEGYNTDAERKDALEDLLLHSARCCKIHLVNRYPNSTAFYSL
jgi:hypothetical protein